MIKHVILEADTFEELIDKKHKIDENVNIKILVVSTNLSYKLKKHTMYIEYVEN